LVLTRVANPEEEEEEEEKRTDYRFLSLRLGKT